MKLFFLTKNKGKFREAEHILSGFGIEIEQLKDERIEIQDEKLGRIALFSAVNSSKFPVITEDAGLFIKVLNGFPGPYSSYVYKTLGCKGILKLMEGMKDRSAEFVSAVAYFNGKNAGVFYGKVKGSIAYEERGKEGFGFDPIFIPEGYTTTFAEMGFEKKSKLSHRAKAFKSLGIWLTKGKS